MKQPEDGHKLPGVEEGGIAEEPQDTLRMTHEFTAEIVWVVVQVFLCLNPSQVHTFSMGSLCVMSNEAITDTQRLNTQKE